MLVRARTHRGSVVVLIFIVSKLSRYSIALAALPLGLAVDACGQSGLLQNHFERKLSPREAWQSAGPVDFSVRMAGTTTHDDNITITSGAPLKDFIFNATPGFTVSTGDYYERANSFLIVDYSPNFQFFRRYSQNNAINHEADVTGQYHFSKLTFGLTHRFEKVTEGVVDVGSRVERTVNTTEFKTNYRLAKKTTLDVNLKQTLTDYPLVTARQWENEDYVNYEVFRRTTLGVGGKLGYLQVKNQHQQTFEQALAKVQYKLSGKTELSASFGPEWRQFGNGVTRDLRPVGSLGLYYAPQDNTRVTVGMNRTEEVSVSLLGQNYTATSLGARVFQKVFTKGVITVGGGYQRLGFHASGLAAPPARRDDDYWYGIAGFDWNFDRHWTAGVLYQHRENVSSLSQFAFLNNQISVQASARF